MDCEFIEGFNVVSHHYSVIDSTNSFLKREASSLFLQYPSCDLFVVTAGKQSLGRGQRDSVWQSAPDENLLISFLLRPEGFPVSSAYSFSVAAALALKNCVQQFGIDASLKWPNDLYFDNRKLAGLLVETGCSGSNLSQLVLGIGLNVNQKEFAPMERRPVSMSLIKGCHFSVEEVKSALVVSFLQHYKKLLSGGAEVLFAEYERKLMGYHTSMLYRDADGEFEAMVQGVERDGRIILLRNDGKLLRYYFKEIETVIFGY